MMSFSKKEKEINSIDWEFADADTSYATHNFHRYSSKFIPQIASSLVKIFSKKGDTVLDVFVGSGTTVVECSLLSRHSIGIDMNPIAYIISRVKVTKLPDHSLDKDIPHILRKMEQDIYCYRMANSETYGRQERLFNFAGPNTEAPDYKKAFFKHIDAWFQPQTIEELCIIKEYINRIKDEKLKRFFICGFSGIIRKVSNAKSDYGNLMIDKDKRKIKNTFEIFKNHILKMVEGSREFNSTADDNVSAKIYLADSKNLAFIPDCSVDLIVTHPPYMGAVPYAEYQKLSLNWVREAFPYSIRNGLSKNLSPKELDKNILGGQRRGKDVVDKFNEGMKKIFSEMVRVLKKSKFCCVVIGNPVVFGRKIELNKKLKNFGEDANLYFEHEIVRGKYRTTMGKMKEEYILIFRK